MTAVLSEEDMIHVVGWYDDEWGYASRVADKEEMRQGDERAREILERTETLSQEQFMKLHGVIRSLRPVDEGSEHE